MASTTAQSAPYATDPRSDPPTGIKAARLRKRAAGAESTSPGAGGERAGLVLAALGAVKRGDFSVRLPQTWDGTEGRIADAFNDLVRQNDTFALELARIGQVVGREGRIAQRVRAASFGGSWDRMLESINGLVSDLAQPTSEMARVIGAVAKGDLTQTMAVEFDGHPLAGEFLRTAKLVNSMVEQLASFSSEVTRVAREVGTEGKLGGQAKVKSLAGTWKDLTDSVNSMAANLTSQVRNITEVTTAVASGDLSKKITVDVRGEILQLKDTINTMVDQLRSFSSEVTRVAREVGTEGKLGGQAVVPGVSGTWKDLTDNVNFMAANLTSQVRNIAQVTTAVATGDLSKKITVDTKGEILELKDTINTMVDQLNSFAAEVTRVAREVGTEGKLGGQAQVRGVSGTWKDLTDNVNFMAANLTSQVRNIAQVTTAVATGDLSKKITADARGEILELKDTINTMVDRLNAFAAEVTRVAREVGTEGKLGGQAQVGGVSGTWRDLTDNVNSMAANLTDQVRGIAKVVTSVANGELNRALTLQAKGEIAALAETINSMIETLATFADQVTTVAREVGVEGRLGGQAVVPGASGTWRALTDNVNQLAANLTTQVRAIADVATAVTKGDLSRSVQVQTRGEVEELKNNINEMIRNLKETTQANAEQDWLKTNVARFTRLLQGQRDLLEVSRLTLSELAPLVGAQHGVFYVLEHDEDGEPLLRMKASYGFQERRVLTAQMKLGESLVGQAALEKKRILLANVPGDYVRINSGLGEAPPLNVVVLPVMFEGQAKAVIELASFDRFSMTHQAFLEQLTESLGIVINTIQASMRTEDLLKQSQSLATELQSQQNKLQQTNEELGEKARLLEEQKVEVEIKNKEVERAKTALEEKAEQLALTSKYKSEFLSNMSHELRTPLNSLLILAQQLEENPRGNLDGRQVEFASTIHNAGKDLLALINDILDLSKIESGTVTLDLQSVSILEIRDVLERVFRHLAERRGLGFDIRVAAGAPDHLFTDSKRLQQVLKNLLSNAIKFTERGSVTVEIAAVDRGWTSGNPALDQASSVVAFSVVDTGIGIPRDKHRIVFEAFQQADSGTSRRFGGTGLGLAISRELSQLLGGELVLDSDAGLGSRFTLYLPATHQQSAVVGRALTEDAAGPRTVVATVPQEVQLAVNDDRSVLAPQDRVLLVACEDDVAATNLLDAAHAEQFRVVVARSVDTALHFLRQYAIAAVALETALQDASGWLLLDRIKTDPDWQHLPVALFGNEADEHGIAAIYGAVAYQRKPAHADETAETMRTLAALTSGAARRLLVVGPEDEALHALLALLGDADLETRVASADAALAALEGTSFDGVLVDARAGDDCDRLAAHLTSDGEARPPVIVIDGTTAPSAKHGVYHVRTPEDAFCEVALRLHRPLTRVPEAQRDLLRRRYAVDASIVGLRVMLVDDDVRNIFAMTSLLEAHGVQVTSADSGENALKRLAAGLDVNLVLMDMMMPQVDGYETTRRVRRMPGMESLPVIAVTARAMKGDREKCLAAGASDYLSKPVDSELLYRLLRIWSPHRLHEVRRGPQ